MSSLEGIIKIRIIGSHDCEKCQALVKLYKFEDMEFEYVDANASENEKFCDEHKIDELPHVQAYHGASKKIVVSAHGFIAPSDILLRIRRALAAINNNSSQEAVIQAEKPSRECGNCNHGKAGTK